MEVMTGTDRRVVIGKRLVYKFPRINVGHALKTAHKCHKNHGTDELKKRWSMSPSQPLSIKWYALHGLMANRREARLARTYPSIVLATRTLLYGLVNIQPKTNPPLGLDDVQRATIFDEDLRTCDTPGLGHMIGDNSNFGVRNDGSVVMVDGGSQNLETMLARGYHDELKTVLDKLAHAHACYQIHQQVD